MAGQIRELNFVDPSALSAHPLQGVIYDDGFDADLLESIEKTGIIQPIICTRDYTIISGHRRWGCSIELGMEKVPIEVRVDLKDDLDIEECLILSNRSRSKTVEQKAREVSALERIESVRADQRKKAGVESPDGDTGEALEKAAKSVGMSRNTARKAKKVVSAIDEADAEGDSETADRLRGLLEKSVSKAHKTAIADATDQQISEVDSVGRKVPDHLIPVFSVTAIQISQMIFSVTSMKKRIEDLAADFGGERINVPQMIADTQNLLEGLNMAKPYAVCPMCKAAGCEHCDDLGWMHKDRHDGVVVRPEDAR